MDQAAAARQNLVRNFELDVHFHIQIKSDKPIILIPKKWYKTKKYTSQLCPLYSNF